MKYTPTPTIIQGSVGTGNIQQARRMRMGKAKRSKRSKRGKGKGDGFATLRGVGAL